MLQAKPLVNQVTPSVHLFEVTPNLESRIQSLKGDGQPLPKSDRAYFEPRFCRDFNRLRVHTDAQAAESARAMNARAFTIGQDVVFGTLYKYVLL